MKEKINNFLEKYVYYKPVSIDDYSIHNDKFVIDKRLEKPERAAETLFDPNFGFEKGIYL